MTNNAALVSVIIPTYNRAELVCNAIDSVIQQQVDNVEIVVVDDGSTDNTEQTLAKYGDSIRYIYQENTGLVGARNTGIRQSSGDWISFLDSDDVWLPNKLKVQLEELERSPDAVAHLTNVKLQRSFANDEDIFSLRNMLSQFKGEESLYLERPLALNAVYNFSRVQSALVKRSAITATSLFSTAYPYFEEEIMHRISLEGPWLVSPIPYAIEIRHEEAFEAMGDASRRKPYIAHRSYMDSLLSLLSDQRVNDTEQKILVKQLSRYAYLTARLYMKADIMDKAKQAINDARAWEFNLKNQMLYLATFIPFRFLR